MIVVGFGLTKFNFVIGRLVSSFWRRNSLSINVIANVRVIVTFCLYCKSILYFVHTFIFPFSFSLYPTFSVMWDLQKFSKLLTAWHAWATAGRLQLRFLCSRHGGTFGHVADDHTLPTSRQKKKIPHWDWRKASKGGGKKGETVFRWAAPVCDCMWRIECFMPSLDTVDGSTPHYRGEWGKMSPR